MDLPDAPAIINVDDLDSEQPIPKGYDLVDVRERDEWEAGHAPNAIHIPMGDIPTRLADLPDSAQIILVCRRGGRSARVQQWLSRNGYDCLDINGGMLEWERAKLPLVCESDNQPTII